MFPNYNRRFAVANGATGGAAAVALVPALAGFKVRVYGFSQGTNATINSRFEDTAAAVIYATHYGASTFGRAYSEQAAEGGFLFESGSGLGVNW